MDVEKLKNRIAELDHGVQEKNAAIQQVMADLNIMIGAKAELERWLKDINGN